MPNNFRPLDHLTVEERDEIAKALSVQWYDIAGIAMTHRTTTWAVREIRKLYRTGPREKPNPVPTQPPDPFAF
jgi:hypothetical protein